MYHIKLWALLHFIMPTLFDSHQEFTEWFSKDIESHAENKSALNERTLPQTKLHHDIVHMVALTWHTQINCPGCT